MIFCFKVVYCSFTSLCAAVDEMGMCFWRLAARVKFCYQNKKFKNKSRYIDLKNGELKMLLSKNMVRYSAICYPGSDDVSRLHKRVVWLVWVSLVMVSIQLKDLFRSWCKQFLNWKQKFKLIACNHRVSLRWRGLGSLLTRLPIPPQNFIP